jgi:hypothetical protein
MGREPEPLPARSISARSAASAGEIPLSRRRGCFKRPCLICEVPKRMRQAPNSAIRSLGPNPTGFVGPRRAGPQAGGDPLRSGSGFQRERRRRPAE